MADLLAAMPDMWWIFMAGLVVGVLIGVRHGLYLAGPRG